MRFMTKALALALLVLVAAPAGAQTLVGSISGDVKDEQGGALPGVTVSLIGKTGTKTTTTGTDGTYRFSAVDPGTYAVQATMTGFSARQQDNVVISVGKTIGVDFAMKIGGVTETVNVVGEAPVVDVSSSATQNELSQDLLFNMPIRQGSNAGVNLLNFAPGINNSSAYGGDASSGNGLLIDGVDTRDPSGGTPWTFFNFNIVEEVQFQGIGAPAEYGAFTGAIVNTITKSGGNRFQGLFDAIYTKSSLASDNLTSEITTANPALADPAKTNELLDVTAQLGGPIIPDKLFFFVSAQRFHLNNDPSGPATVRDEVSPRMNFKLTWQPSANDSVMAHVQFDSYSIIGRCGVAVLVCTDNLTNREDAPEWVWVANWRHLFGSRTFIEAKYTGWWGFYDLNPEVDTPLRSDETGAYAPQSGQGWFYYGDRDRHQLNASISHFADAFGRHNLKFGVEVERSKTRDRYGTFYYYDYAGSPYYAYEYGYDISGRNQRESVYAQDSWEIGNRLTINAGARADFVRGKSPEQSDAVYSTTNIAPRLGFAFDLTGDHKTVLKGSYSQYYEGIFNSVYSAGTPGIGDFVTYDVTACPSTTAPCSRSLFQETDRSPSTVATIDPDLKHPRVDEISVGIERSLGSDIRLSLSGMRRQTRNIVGSVFPDARWEQRILTSTSAPGYSPQPVPVYRWMNSSASENNILITNPDGFVFRDVNGNPLGTIDAERDYRALMAVLSKRFSHRWLSQVSYVLSKAEGSRDNSSVATQTSGTQFFRTPTLALTNTNGESTNSRRHELKVMLGVQVPVIEVGLNAYFRALSGRPYNAEQRFASSAFGGGTFVPLSSWRTPFVEGRGTRRRESEKILDLRLEKIFNLGSGRRNRLAVYADLTNVLNETDITTVQVRVPTLAITGVPDPVAFGAPAGINPPRQLTLGARWSF